MTQDRITDLEDIIKILIYMLENNNVSKDIIKLELRKYHYCYDCYNHYRGCKCGEEVDNNLDNSDNSDSSDNSSVDDTYTSSEYDDDDDKKLSS